MERNPNLYNSLTIFWQLGIFTREVGLQKKLKLQHSNVLRHSHSSTPSGLCSVLWGIPKYAQYKVRCLGGTAIYDYHWDEKRKPLILSISFHNNCNFGRISSCLRNIEGRVQRRCQTRSKWCQNLFPPVARCPNILSSRPIRWQQDSHQLSWVSWAYGGITARRMAGVPVSCPSSVYIFFFFSSSWYIRSS